MKLLFITRHYLNEKMVALFVAGQTLMLLHLCFLIFLLFIQQSME